MIRTSQNLVRCAATTLLLGTASLATAQHGPATTGKETEDAPKKVHVIPATPLVPAAAAPAPQEAQPAQESKVLRIGDTAPKPALAEILKGKTDFVAFPEDNVTVMEFWATWCGPCKAGMPHLSEVQKEYADKGVTIIGVSREEPKVVKDFLAKPEWDEKTGYTIALDEDSKTNESYMKAAKQNGIPCAFIVDQKGRVAWIGHPMTMDEPLKQIVAGEWDIEKARIDFENREKVAQIQMAVRRAMFQASRSGDYGEALAVIEKAIEEMPEDQNLRMMKFQALAATGDGGAYDIAWDILKANRDNAMMMNSIAWFVLDDANVKNRDFEFAMAAAKAANDASGGNDPAILDTLARAYFEKGDLDMAIEIQQKAVDRVEGPGAAQFVETLEKYKKAANDRPA